MNFSGGMLKTQDIKELLGIVEVGQISQFVDSIVRQNAKDAIVQLNVMAEEGVDLQEFAKTLVFYLRQALLLKINPDFLTAQNSGLSAEEIATMRKQTGELTEKAIQNMLELFIDAENKMKYSNILQLPLELAIIDITQKES